MTRTHQFEAMLPREFRAEFERAPVIYCPFGSVEYHGTHQSMAIDFSKGHVICLRAAAISGGVVHPTIPIVPGGVPPRTMEELKKFNFQACPGVFGDRDLCWDIIAGLADFFAECLKFKLCVLFGAHGPAGHMVKAFAEKCGGMVSGMHLLAIGLGDYIKDELLKAKAKYGLKNSGAHGGLWETSINMAIDPSGVDLSELDKPFDGFYEMVPEVVAENRHATAEFGEFLINTCAKRLAEDVRKMLVESDV
jgi:creatinine amidohydrolase